MYRVIKRIMDIILSLLVLIIFFIPMLIIAIAIKAESNGPVLFKQKRTGKNGKEFYLYKFRSMTADNDVHNFKSENKLTKVGKFIRRTSLDELPQIICNILIKGNMSFIGPRPWIPDYYENFTEEQKRRVEVTPGLTGLAQCKGRNGIGIFEKIKYDIEYVDNMSLLMDIKIIFLTVKCVLSKSGAELSKSGIKEELDILHNNLISSQEEKKINTRIKANA